MQYFDPGAAEGEPGSYPLASSSSFLYPADTRIPFTPPTTANQPSNVLQPLSGGQKMQDQYEESSENQQGLTLQTLLRQTGLGIKVRFLLALTLIALFPALILVSGAARAYGHWLVWAYRSFCLRPGTSRLCS